MKTKIILFCILGIVFYGMSVFSQTSSVNQLTIPVMETKQGKDVLIPVYMANSDEITGIQVNIRFPQGVTPDLSKVALSDRKDNHTVSVRPTGNNDYLFIIFSADNQLIKGKSGILFTVPVSIPAHWEEGSEYPLSFNQVILSSVQGDNLTTTSDAGAIKVIIEPRPDIAVRNIQIEQNSVSPGEKLSIAYSIENVGDESTGGGWKEQVSLTDEKGNQRSLGTFYQEEILTAGNVVSRQAEFSIPLLVGMEGNVKVQVRVIPDNDLGELPSAQGNNALESEQPLNLSKRLLLETPQYAIAENSSSLIQCKLSRTGDWSMEQVFTLSTNVSERISLPASVTIPAKQSGALFYISLVDNSVLDIDSLVFVSAAGNGYEAVSESIRIEDNEQPSLSLASSKQELQEGDVFSLTIEKERISSSDLLVRLACDHAKRFEFPSQVTIPAGQKSLEIEVLVKDDNIPDVTVEALFTATATNHISARHKVLLYDDDVPDISLSITPETVGESAGPLAVSAVLRRLNNKESNITVKLTDNSNGTLYYSSSQLQLAPGVEEARFTIGVIDNADVDGDRVIDITAAVYISSCNCASEGTNAGVVKAQLAVLDDDGPALKIVSSQTMLQEGKTEAAVLTITRNTSTEEALTVTIGSDHDEELSYDKTVTIPAGSKSVQVPISVLANEEAEGDRTVVFTVTTDGYAKGICWVMISDQTLPDAVIESIELSVPELEAEGVADLKIIVTNKGAFSLPANAPVNVYLSNSSAVYATYYTKKQLDVDESETITQQLTFPDITGSYTLHAVVNENQSIRELLFLNNQSEAIPVKLLPKFTASVTTDKATYKQGEVVVITGQLTGSKTANTKVEVYLISVGIRQTLEAATDASGHFQTTFQPSVYQSGHFIAGACYPGEGLTDEQAVFDIYGTKRGGSSYITHDLTVNEPYQGAIPLTNTGVLALHNVRAEIVSKPENCTIDFEPVSSLAGNETQSLRYTLTGNAASEGADWQQVKIRIASDESELMEVALFVYFRMSTGKLEANISSIHTTMTKGASRDYSFTITNTGKGATGKISLSLPANASWLSLATPKEMVSLNPNESATVVLRFTPTDNMPLNVPVTGTIGVNCENGVGFPLAFSIEPVSESTGTLIVDVCDEYTYYTAEAPHLAGAKVVIKHPVTGAVVIEGITGADGLFVVNDLQEGYYAIEVSADKHDRYQNNILIDPGKENRKVVNLSFQAITYSWEVVETEVEDEYEIVTTVKYETNVPVPVVEVTFPKTLEFEDQIFPIYATNKGLISAQNVTVKLPELDEIAFELLSPNSIPSLAPQQSVVFYVKMTINEQPQLRVAGPHHIIGCIAGAIGLYYTWYCGLENKLGAAMANYTWGECASIFPSWGSSGGGGGTGPGGPNGGPEGHYEPSSNSSLPTITRDCKDCDLEFAGKVADCALGCTPVGCIWGLGRCAWTWLSNSSGKQRIYCTIMSIAGCIPVISCPVSIAGCIRGLLDPCDNILNAGSLRSGNNNNYSSYILAYQEKINYAYDEYLEIVKLTNEFFGDDAWAECEEKELYLFYSRFLELDPLDAPFSYDDLLSYLPSNISIPVLTKFVDRWNNTRRFLDGEEVQGEIVDITSIDGWMENIRYYESKAMEYGYESTSDMVETEMRNLHEWLDDKQSSSVCASISLQFSQTMTMTRQAFRGTLTVFNGHESIPMENVRLDLVVKDEQGNIATSHEFQINNESLKEFGGELNGAWSLEAQQTGVATIVFIPTKYAAPAEPVSYSFGGTLSYTDPFTGLEVTRDLYPVTLTVKPSPNLELTYFMQRDVLGDDPLTPNVIEPMVPAEFSLLINNIGVGDATDLRMVTQQPKIVDNQKGLYINFELLSSQLNGGEHTLALGGSVPTDFGTIPGGKTAYAQWWFTGSLLGHFTEYDVKATHISSYGNPDLSLLDKVTIHELIRSIRVPDSDNSFLSGFVVNDISDPEDLPDRLYLSDGTTEPISYTSGANISMNDNSRFTLTVTSSSNGWNYGTINDPTSGYQDLLEIRRVSDNTVIDLRNFWQTDRTLRDGKDPLYENKLHFVDRLNTGSEQYILTFTPRPEVFLEVEAFEGAPQTVSATPVSEITVRFNKNIDAATFTTKDIRLICQGEAMDASSIGITQVNDKVFVLNLSPVTLTDGYYVLTIQTTGITDSEGYSGKTGKSVDWNQFMGGKMQFNLNIEPEEGGTVTPLPGKYDFGSALNLKAEPNEGYLFEKWSISGETLSTEPDYRFTLLSGKTLTATFKLKLVDLTVTSDNAAGKVTGAGTGKYEYGTNLVLKAEAFANYAFESWKVNGEIITNPVLEIKLSAKTSVEAIFRHVRTTLNWNLAENWNWISFNTQGEVLPGAFLSPVLTKVNKIVSNDGEAVYDPETGFSGTLENMSAGKAYKLNMRQAGSLLWEGNTSVTSTPIQLHEGWNWIGYLPTVTLTPEIALSGLDAAHNELIKGHTAFSVFDGSQWVGTLTNMKAGEGYLYYATSDKTFVYSSNSTAIQGSEPPYSNPVSSWNVKKHQYPDNMNVIAQLYIDEQITEAGIYTVGAFCGNECRGVGQYVDGRLFITIHGEDTQETIGFKAYENATGEELLIGETFLFANTLAGTLDNPVALNAQGSNSLNHLQLPTLVLYPNPVKQQLFLGGLNAEAIKHWKILTTTGLLVLSADYYDEKKGMPVASLPNGTYILSLFTDEGVLYRKFIK